MRVWTLALKRLWRRGVFPGFCLLLVLAALGASFLGDADSLTPAGICDLDGTVLSHAVADRLEEGGFLPYESEAELRADLVSRRIDIGILLPEGFSDTLMSPDPSECAVFIEGAGAFVPQLWLNQATAAIFAEKTPYVTAEALDQAGAGIPEGEVFSSYRAMMEEGALFSFEIRWSGQDENTETPDRSRSYVLGTVALLLFVGMTLGVTGLLGPKEAEPVRRIGSRAAFFRLTLPMLALECAAVIVSLAAASAAGMLAGGRGTLTDVLLPAAAYTLILTGFAGLLQGILRRAEWICGFVFALTLFSLLLLPIWMDTALLFPALGIVRLFLPPYWLWLAAESPLAAFAASLPVLAAGGWVLYRELKRRALRL